MLRTKLGGCHAHWLSQRQADHVIRKPLIVRTRCHTPSPSAWLPGRSSRRWQWLAVGLLGILGGCTQGRWAWWRAAEAPTAPLAAAESSAAAGAASRAAYPATQPGLAEGPSGVAQAGATRPVAYPEHMLFDTPTPAPATPVQPVSTAAGSRPHVDANEFEPAKIMARVGDEVILAGDLMGPINQALEPYLEKMPKEHIEMQRELLMRQQVKQSVDNKLMYVAALRNIPPDKRDEALPQIWQKLHAKFDEEELPKAIERAKVETAAELDAKLREYGWSLAKQRRQYAERQIGMSGAADAVNDVPEITHQDLLDYYQSHNDDYAFAAQARWEQLSVRFERVADRGQAYEQIVRMGNEVALGGAPLWAVAKRDSHDSNASQGGQYDWTHQGSLVSQPLDDAIFNLPVGQLSQIIEDDRGFHIVRVLERREAGRTPFTEAQGEIRKRLEGEKRQQAFQQYLENLRRDIPVWTVYDEPS